MSEEQDWISALPDAILHHILSFLPTELPIQTNILSKRWIHLWKFSRVIDIPITVPYKLIDESEYCIEFAISRQVQILSVAAILLVLLPEECYAMPSMFHLHDNVRSLEQPFLGEDETLKRLMSIYPVLESLTIASFYTLINFKTYWCQSKRLKHLVFRWMDGIGLNLEVDVSNLSSVQFFGDLMQISLSTLPSIVEARVFQQANRQYKEEFEHISTLVGNLIHVKQLGVNSWFPQFVARELKVNSNGWANVQNLKVFSWFGPFVKETDLIALLAFLGQCSSLEKIELGFRTRYSEAFDDYIQAYAFKQSFVELNNGEGELTVEFLHNLKIIKVHHFFSYKSEIELVKRLLQKGAFGSMVGMPKWHRKTVPKQQPVSLPTAFPNAAVDCLHGVSSAVAKTRHIYGR
ncbi:uncharacterized protein LOC111293378 [Durio zibethinus]|uniref:Uncharacterized protein LOC111293378 n=1 Tax=Durio zibethinus TaxID=66656 RepID=A0A6P5YNJ4_DURZI|nr:uncharacterized protein LOC111293378 [Durio zibethinus]